MDDKELISKIWKIVDELRNKPASVSLNNLLKEALKQGVKFGTTDINRLLLEINHIDAHTRVFGYDRLPFPYYPNLLFII